MVDMAFSAASLESYLPIIFMPAFISVITEHVWVVLSRPTKYVPAVNAKAGETNAPIKATASTCFLILVSLRSNLPPDGDGTPRKHIVWRATKSIFRNRQIVRYFY